MKRAMCAAKVRQIFVFWSCSHGGNQCRSDSRSDAIDVFGRSLEPIIPIEASITRIAITKASDFLKKQTEMGRKPFVSWAVYEQCGFYNAPLGAPADKGGTGVNASP